MKESELSPVGLDTQTLTVLSHTRSIATGVPFMRTCVVFIVTPSVLSKEPLRFPKAPRPPERGTLGNPPPVGGGALSLVLSLFLCLLCRERCLAGSAIPDKL